ncbi:Acetyl-CoA carboxylase 2 [Fukomys damarensis]|uniref:Acetyl-CoA carboxylase 2 n=1 Tax=Fukomys damarensis TaxID=885580 RepID=A0A091CZS3_FUKDA|nr:Acetyl-CoA carboxylase 2 [Fukomys damarensis]
MLWSPLQLKEWVQELMMTLRHPLLPLLELQENMTSVESFAQLCKRKELEGLRTALGELLLPFYHQVAVQPAHLRDNRTGCRRALAL